MAAARYRHRRLTRHEGHATVDEDAVPLGVERKRDSGNVWGNRRRGEGIDRHGSHSHWGRSLRDRDRRDGRRWRYGRGVRGFESRLRRPRNRMTGCSARRTTAAEDAHGKDGTPDKQRHRAPNRRDQRTVSSSVRTRLTVGIGRKPMGRDSRKLGVSEAVTHGRRMPGREGNRMARRHELFEVRRLAYGLLWAPRFGGRRCGLFQAHDPAQANANARTRGNSRKRREHGKLDGGGERYPRSATGARRRRYTRGRRPNGDAKSCKRGSKGDLRHVVLVVQCEPLSAAVWLTMEKTQGDNARRASTPVRMRLECVLE